MGKIKARYGVHCPGQPYVAIVDSDGVRYMTPYEAFELLESLTSALAAAYVDVMAVTNRIPTRRTSA